MYAYCLNNPVNMYDPDGRCSRFLGFLWKIDCKQASCPESKNYVKPKAVDPIGSYNKGQGVVYIVKPGQQDSILKDGEKNVVVIIDYRVTESTDSDYDQNMRIVNSYKIKSTKQQTEIAQIMIDYNTANPVSPAWNRTLDSMLIEWMAHNHGYSLRHIVALFKEDAAERLKHVDFNNKDETLGYWDYLGK